MCDAEPTEPTEPSAAPDPLGHEDAHEPREGSDPLRFNHWMKRSATGVLMSGITLGLREALEPTKKNPAFVVEASGQPEDPDNPIRLHFDPDSPAGTVAVIRLPPGKDRPDPPPPTAEGAPPAGPSPDDGSVRPD